MIFLSLCFKKIIITSWIFLPSRQNSHTQSWSQESSSSGSDLGLSVRWVLDMVVWGVEHIDQSSVSDGVDVLAGGVENSRLTVDDRAALSSLVDHVTSGGQVVVGGAGIVTPVVTIVSVLTGTPGTAVRLPGLSLKVGLTLVYANICKEKRKFTVKNRFLYWVVTKIMANY